MSIQVKLKDEEIALVDILRHPTLGPEFIRNFNDIPEDPELPINFNNDLYYEHTDYQKLMLCDFNSFVTYCTARAVGKTESLIDKLTFFLVNDFWPGYYITFITPSRVHLEPVFTKLRRWLKDNEFLRHLVTRNSINSGTFTIKLTSGGSLDCRIAGTTGTGQNVVGLHTPVVLIDEAAYFPWGTWSELQPIINHWMDGFQVIVAGVPDGRREKSVLYHVDQKDPLYTSHRISSHDNPRWDEAAEMRALEQYGGINSEDYIHMVLGEHGSPTFAVFDRELMKLENYETAVVELRGSMLKEDSQLGYKQILDLPGLPRNFEHVIFGVDLGYTEPTAIVVMYQSNEKWYQLARLNWFSVDYDEQRKLLMALDGKYNPAIIGIDEGSNKAFVQLIMADEKYKDRKFSERIVPINFSASVAVGKDEDGEDLKLRAKEFSVQYLQQLTNLQKIVYTKQDEELITEFERTTYTKSIGGQITFRTYTQRGSDRGSDHNLAAYLSGFLAWYIKKESFFVINSRPKLAKATWNWT
jgi:hypothetical protein